MGSINCYVPNRSGDKIEIDMIMLCQIKIIQDGYLVTKKVRTGAKY